MNCVWQQHNSIDVRLQATLAACNVTAVLKQQPVTKGSMLPFVDGPFKEIPGEAPSIVNAKDLPSDKFPQYSK